MKCEFGLCAFEGTGSCFVVDSCKQCDYGKLVFKNISMRVIKTDSSSQSCPVCNVRVNNQYCPNCGQKLKY